jgi:hypothetical protein
LWARVIDALISMDLDHVMTGEEAHERIIQSRSVLQDYLTLAAVGERPGPLDMSLIADEIALLESIAEEHPTKSVELVRMVSEWVAFRERMRISLN